MQERDWLAEQFEQNRIHLRGVAYRMLGSLSEADDAVQESWLRLNRADTSSVENLGGWLTTVTARVCLDMLRSRKSRHEESLEGRLPEPVATHTKNKDPEAEVLLADSVGLALLVVLDTLAPAERLAFVLHDMFDLTFEEIAAIVGRSPDAARQLASRARRRVQGKPRVPSTDLRRQRKVVDAFLAAARSGDMKSLLALLDPQVVLRFDRFAVPKGAPAELRGADAVANRAVLGGARAARPMLVNGDVGVVGAPRGHLRMVCRFTISGGKVVAIESVADPERLAQLELAVLPE